MSNVTKLRELGEAVDPEIVFGTVAAMMKPETYWYLLEVTEHGDYI